MAERVEGADFRPSSLDGRRSYDWAAWTDGQCWRICRGEDFDMEPEIFRTYLYITARRKGMKVRTTFDGPGAIVFQFYEPTKKETKLTTQETKDELVRAQEVRAAVVDQLLVLLPSNSKLREGGRIQHWHSGGGIVGIQITLESGAHLFGTLEQDGDRQQWTGFDFNAPDGEDSEYIAYLEVQVRPIGQPDEATPNQFAEAIVKLLKHVR